MKDTWIKTVRAMRDAGYLVVIWTPDELGDVPPRHVEDVVIERGNDMIEMMRGEQVMRGESK